MSMFSTIKLCVEKFSIFFDMEKDQANDESIFVFLCITQNHLQTGIFKSPIYNVNHS